MSLMPRLKPDWRLDVWHVSRRAAQVLAANEQNEVILQNAFRLLECIRWEYLSMPGLPDFADSAFAAAMPAISRHEALADIATVLSDVATGRHHLEPIPHHDEAIAFYRALADKFEAMLVPSPRGGIDE